VTGRWAGQHRTGAASRRRRGRRRRGGGAPSERGGSEPGAAEGLKEKEGRGQYRQSAGPTDGLGADGENNTRIRIMAKKREMSGGCIDDETRHGASLSLAPPTPIAAMKRHLK